MNNSRAAPSGLVTKAVDHGLGYCEVLANTAAPPKAPGSSRQLADGEVRWLPSQYGSFDLVALDRRHVRAGHQHYHGGGSAVKRTHFSRRLPAVSRLRAIASAFSLPDRRSSRAPCRESPIRYWIVRPGRTSNFTAPTSLHLGAAELPEPRSR